ncbi:helix-turn-helix domain-containing protein [Gilvimarinus sp. SDUM040013]|uniref:Helix-turn-helix domain-containing protein n=1 Tax=Gilvimarinus gilvus TaxID=3058038 RepID=A0ABU4S0Q7_9GAMM|nr:helix-turn-helix domain-containing protein [Gilvimarinus sp. SDUM040013]MDO3387187.1 helix-turn-helix domain-containing protein [Gilvimarinus sp. SDUM040013]MDX6850750.1 helix-turn-helix domain-containing protein [Gilvimarinus sp. SDUM040013]
MNIFQLSIYAMAFGLCVFTALLVWRSSEKNHYFLFFLLVLCAALACDWLMHHPSTPLKGLWLLGVMVGALLVGPCALLLASNLGNPSIADCKTLHIGLVLAGLLLLLPLASAIYWGNSFASPNSQPSKLYAVFIHTTMLLSVGVFCVQTVLVIRACYGVLERRVQQNRILLSELSDPGLNILRMLLVAVGINAIIAIVRVLYCALLEGSYFWLNLAVVSGQLLLVGFLAASYMRQLVVQASNTEHVRRELFVEPHSIEKDIHGEQRVSQDTSREVERGGGGLEKYAKSKVSSDVQNAIWEKLNAAIEMDKLYKRPGLSLRELCDHVTESPHHVSQVINDSDYGNFYHFINRHRVADASRLLQQDNALSILEIAFECGFNSKSSFNAVFKRYIGQTPSQHRQNPQELFYPQV